MLLNVVTVSTHSIPNNASLISRAFKKHRAANQYYSALYKAQPRPQQGRALSGLRQAIFYRKDLQLQKELNAQSSLPAERQTPPFENQKKSQRLGPSQLSSFHALQALLQFQSARAQLPSLCALIAAQMKGKAHSGTSGGQRISAMIEGNGSRGMFPLYREDKGFKEQSSQVASFWKQSQEDSTFLVCSLASINLKTLGGFYPFFSCCFLGLAFILFLFLSYFQGGGCWPIVILGTSLNLAGQGGGSSCFTTISSGMGGSSACNVLSMAGILNCKGSRLASWVCLFFRSQNGLYSSSLSLSLSPRYRSCSTILQYFFRLLRKGLFILGNSFFFAKSQLLLMKRQEVKNLVRIQSNTFLALSIYLLVSTAILAIMQINQNNNSPGSPQLLISGLSRSLEQQSTKKCLQQNSFSLAFTGGTTLDSISQTCSMLMRWGRMSASLRNLINETAVIFLFCNSTSLWLSSNLPCFFKVQQFYSTQMRYRFLNSFSKAQIVLIAFSIIIFLLTQSIIIIRGQVIDSLSAKLFSPSKSLQTLSC